MPYNWHHSILNAHIQSPISRGVGEFRCLLQWLSRGSCLLGLLCAVEGACGCLWQLCFSWEKNKGKDVWTPGKGADLRTAVWNRRDGSRAGQVTTLLLLPPLGRTVFTSLEISCHTSLHLTFKECHFRKGMFYVRGRALRFGKEKLISVLLS